ncbi:MAG: SAM-dependent methyltransferase [Bacteroidales bacterium]|jgi:type I restriction enzyme M protein|nr:SAM-dependent methyltransferase [Bacteroidales bacterium]
MDMPEGYKAFSNTKPIKAEHFETVRNWWNSRVEITDEDGNYKSRKYTKAEISTDNYNLDLCGFPHKVEEILSPDILIKEYFEKKEKLDAKIKNFSHK